MIAVLLLHMTPMLFAALPDQDEPKLRVVGGVYSFIVHATPDRNLCLRIKAKGGSALHKDKCPYHLSSGEKEVEVTFFDKNDSMLQSCRFSREFDLNPFTEHLEQ